MGRLKLLSLGFFFIVNERCWFDIFIEIFLIVYCLYVVLLLVCIREISWFDKSDEMRNRFCFYRNIFGGSFYLLSLWIEYSYFLWKRIFFFEMGFYIVYELCRIKIVFVCYKFLCLIINR